MPEALMARTTSPGPGAGSGNSCSSSFRSPRKTTPRIGLNPPGELLADLLPRRLVDEPGGGDIFNGKAERLEHGCLPSPGRLRAVEDLPGLGIDRGLGEDHVSGFLEGRLPRVRHGHDDVRPPHGRLRVHRLGIVLPREALRVLARPAPHPNFLEAAY